MNAHWKESANQGRANYPALLLLAFSLLMMLVGTAAHAANFPLTITANNITKTYGTPVTLVTAPPIPPAIAPLPDYTVTGSLQAGDTVDSVALTSAGTPAAAPVAGSPYPIVPSAAAMTITSGNTYTITYVSGSMTVTPTTATLVHPEYRRPILMPVSQASTIWTNVIPNALADYYTYVPFKNADAVALGFPATCGNPLAVGATAADLASTEDCYSLSVRKFQQQLALPGIFAGGQGLIDPATNTPFAAATTWVYGYGSGGVNWTLPYYDTTKTNVATGLPVVPTPVTGNAPAFFANNQFDVNNTGIWHFPAPTIKGSKGRPVRVQWLNDLPNEIPTGFDPSICGNAPADCFPYNRIVTHLHGAHVGPESDGMVHAWFTPGFTQKGPLWESTRQFGPEGTYFYPMDQEAGTIWYHDHSTGLTHNNVNMGMAGFFPISDANEKLLQTNNILPPAARELGFALQDRVFYDNGQMAMPDAPILAPAFVATCTYLPPDPVTGDILVTSGAGTCSPVFMKAPDGHLVPYPAVPGNPAPAAYLGTSATLEFFGNMPVVNGVTYGKYNVDRGVYRIRFLGGTDSRGWALRLKVAGSNPARYLPFWQIGAEQGLLNNPAKVDHLLIMPGERVDVLVDFNSAETVDAAGLSAGPLNLSNARIIVENWAGDAPYGGEIFLPVSDPLAMDFRSADIPEIMAFDVSAVSVAADVLPPSTATSLRVNIPVIPNLTVTPPPLATPVRTVSLVEIVDNYQRVMPTIDGRGFMDFGVSELPKLNTTEQWDIVNTTVDAHPMHLHQVAFQLINRETIASTCPTSPLAPLCVTPASTAIAPPYTSAVVTAYQPASIENPLPNEIGYKDTIMCPPGKVTRVIATFDIPGAYVWHCHILSHEEHDMMRPMVVTTPAASITLAASNLTQPTAGAMLPVALTAQAYTGIAAYPVGSAFEYDFTVAGPLHSPLPGLTQPTRVVPSFNSSVGDTFNVVKEASWTPPTTPGTYVITASTKAMGAAGAGNPIVTTTLNYIVTNATVTIDPLSLTATYDGTPKAVAILPTTPAGLTVNVTYNGSATPPVFPGNYSVVATISDPNNVSFGTTSAILVINKAALTITASNLNKTYGTVYLFTATNPSPDYTVVGLMTGDAVASVTLASPGTPAAATVAGSPYPVVPSAAIGTGLANYIITYVNGSMTVTPTTATLVHPDYRRPILMPVSQASTIWTNVIPNALADYYTYVPFKNADAVALGFPATCGNPLAVGATAADLASTEDCYSLSVRKFQQQLALPGIFAGGQGLIDPATNTPFAAATTWVYGYGSGGVNWTLPYYDTTKINVATGLPVVPTPVTGNAPSFFANNQFDVNNTGIWHFPAPTIKGAKGRPVRVQWLNDLPNEKPTGFDPSICGNAPADCFPYNRIVTHLHGAHVGPESDGMVHAWFTPGFTQKGPLWESTRQFGPEGTYLYPMDQEAGTLWYHDHSTGLTHNNVNMGMAGFFPVSDANEKLLQTNNILPPATRELGFALQDRVFYDNGQMAMPDAPILDPAFSVTCTYLPPDPVTGDILVTSGAGTCSPVFMKAPDGHLVPYPAVPGNPAPAAYLGTSSTLEFFGNMPVVNGVTYGKHNVDNRVHRMRFLGGTDSRAWVLRLKVDGSNPARYLPFWQIGAEQGLLNNPAKVDHLLIMPGERLDTLVDFSGREVLDAGGNTVLDANNLPLPLNLVGTRIIVENWAGDGPYGGEVILPVSDPLAMDFRSADIPEIMAFDVINGGADNVVAPSAATSLRVNIPAIPNLTVTPPPLATPVRTVSLVEIVDNYQRVMPTIDGRGFMDFGVSELPKLNTTEQWDIVNTTVDAHPMHLHQVAFQLINRETIASTCPTSPLAPLCVTPASTAIAPPYTSAVVTAYQPASIETPLPNEIGYKDTIMCPPGKVTRVIATFDIPGAYVWHCHILSHEEHDMMRPMVVTTPAASITLAASNLTQPTAGAMLPVALTAQAYTGIAAYPVGSAFEYDFTVAGPLHSPLPGLTQPTRVVPSFNSSVGDTFNVVKEASWTPPTTPGTYVITASTKAMGAAGAGNPIVTTTLNYIVTNATVTIDPLSLTATYDGTPKAVAILPTTPAGLTVNVTYNGSATPPVFPGSYSVVATISDPNNISFGTTSAILVINKAPITISANNASRAYGAVNPANPGFTVISGLLAAADSIGSVTYTYQVTATTTAFAGTTHSITPSAALFATGNPANYVITYTNGLLTISKAPLTITANNQTKVYGTAFTFTGLEFTATGLLNSDTVTSVNLTSNGAAGNATVTGSPYPIVPNAIFGTGLSNYTVTLVNGLMTVTKANPVITWATPLAVQFGTALSNTQLNATANIPGTFAYNPAAGTVLNSSSSVLSVTFTPSATRIANYNSATAAVNQVTIAGTLPVAKISTAPAYPSIQAAYNAVISGDVMKVLGTTIPGSFTANRPATTVTVKGGHSSTFTPIVGSTTTIQGTVTLQHGTVIIDGLIVK